MTLGEKLCYLRKKKGISQEMLALQISVSRQAISKWELGEATPDTENILRLSELFGVSIDYLLKDEITEEYPAAPHEPAPLSKPARKLARRQIAFRALIIIAVFAVILVLGVIFHVTFIALSLVIATSFLIVIVILLKALLQFLHCNRQSQNK